MTGPDRGARVGEVGTRAQRGLPAPRPQGARRGHGRAALLVSAALALVPPTARAAPTRSPTPVEATSTDPLARLERLDRALRRDRAEPRALVQLAEIAALEEDLPDLARVAAIDARVAADPSAHPEVRAYARFRLAVVEQARGDLRRSSEALAALAFLGSWTVAGPFDDGGKRGFDEVYPPEREQDLAARFPGKERQVGWRRLPSEAFSMGFVDLGAVVRPAREVVVYALAVVEAPRDERLVVHLGTSGAAKLFVNGALVHADPSYHPARPDQAAVEIGLRRGPNRLLLKLCHAEGLLGFYVRLASLGGAPARLPEVEGERLPAPVPAAAPARPTPGVEAALERRAREARGPRAWRAHRDLALLLLARHSGEEREGRATEEARRAIELAPRSVEARLLAARLEDDANRRRGALEAAIRLDPGCAPALVALARAELSRGRRASAKRLVDRALASAPRYVPARLAAADVLEEAGLVAQARLARSSAARTLPAHGALLVAMARDARAQHRLEEATRFLRGALAIRRDDDDARELLVQSLLDRGDLAGAVALLREALAQDPADQATRLRLAELLAANGAGSDAEAAFAAALRLAPEDAEVVERRGQARLRAGRTKEALADFQRALDLRPQNPRLKALLLAIEPARERFERAYLYDAAELARRAPPAADEDAVVLGDLRVTKVFPSGLSSSFVQLVVQVLTQRGADAWRTWSAPYAPGRQELKVERARVVKPDGAVVESCQESDVSASEPWYRLYYDTRSRVLTFPALAPGDLLEIAVRTDDSAADSLLSSDFGEVVYVAGPQRKLQFDYVLLVPQDRPIHVNEPAGVVRTQRALAGGVVERRFTARDVPRVRPEPGMPGWSEVVPYVHASTFGSWDEVARFYWRLVREQLAVTPPIRSTARRIAAEVRGARRAARLPASGDELALVQAVHRFVVTNTRYVALELGIHGFKPYRVDQVLDRRFGDCKDKASLAHALLEALGIDSRLALLRTRRLGRIAERPASLAVFNHAVLYVPRHDLWLDETASSSGSRELPEDDRGASALVVSPGAPARFTAVPEAAPGDDRSESSYDVALARDGSATVTGELREAGARAAAYRRAFGPEHDRAVQLEGLLGRAFPGLVVDSVEVSDPSRLEDEVRVRFALHLPRAAEPDGDGLRLFPFGRGARYAETLAPLSSRRLALVVGEERAVRLRYRYALPPGVVASALPPPSRTDTPFGRVDVAWRASGRLLLADAQISLRARTVSPAEYPAFRAFLGEVDRALSRPLRLARLDVVGAP